MLMRTPIIKAIAHSGSVGVSPLTVLLVLICRDAVFMAVFVGTSEVATIERLLLLFNSNCMLNDVLVLLARLPIGQLTVLSEVVHVLELEMKAAPAGIVAVT